MKENNLKLIGVIFASLVVIGVAYFFLAIYQPEAGMYVRADVLPEQPDKYIELTSEELKNYPYISEAVSNPGKEVKLPFDHTESIDQFTQMTLANDIRSIKVGEIYYEINVYSAD